MKISLGLDKKSNCEEFHKAPGESKYACVPFSIVAKEKITNLADTRTRMGRVGAEEMAQW